MICIVDKLSFSYVDKLSCRYKNYVPLPTATLRYRKKSKLVEWISFLPSPARDWAGARALPAGGGRAAAAALWKSGKVSALFRFSMAILLDANKPPAIAQQHLSFVAALCGRVIQPSTQQTAANKDRKSVV